MNAHIGLVSLLTSCRGKKSSITLYNSIQCEDRISPFLHRPKHIINNQTAIRLSPIINSFCPLPRENWSKIEAGGLTAQSKVWE